MDNRTNRRNAGFTIIELVVVIVIIGILAATALPRFVDMTGDARSAQVQAIGGAFASGINLAHASWVAQGANAQVNTAPLEGGTVLGLNDTGWPENTANGGGNGTISAGECRNLWNAILTNPPTISNGTGTEWQSTTDNTTCTYTLNAATGRTIAYNSSNGQVTTTVP